MAILPSIYAISIFIDIENALSHTYWKSKSMLPIPAETPVVSKKQKSPKKEAVVLNEDGMVIYTDAGVRPTNPGYGGWGMHGYIYSDVVPKKGCGNPSITLTDIGYLSKADAKKSDASEVTPLKYLDAFSSIENISNNAAEAIAATNGLDIALRFGAKKLQLFSDSEYVVRGINEFLPRWKKNGWIRRDGQLISNLNEWKQLDQKLQEVQAQDVKLTVTWMKAHTDQDGSIGNAIADKYATIAVLNAMDKRFVTHNEFTVPDGYWTAKDTKHPLICLRSAFFSSTPSANIPGEYFLGNHDKDEDLIGKRDTDTGYAYLVLKTPDPIIELMRKRMLELIHTEGAITVCRLSKLFENSLLIDLERMGEKVLFSANKNSMNICYLDKKEVVMRELNPPRICVRAIEAINHLKGLYLDLITNPDSELIITPVNDLFYEKDAKGNLKLKDSIGSGVSSIKVDVFLDKEKTKTKNVELYFDVDLPSRNALKKIESENPEISIILWNEAGQAARYACVVKTDESYGVFAGYYSNLLLTK